MAKAGKWFNRSLAVILSVALLLGGMELPVLAEETADEAVVEISEFDAVTDSGTCGSNLQWEYDSGTLTITGTGAMSDYEWSGAPWDSKRSSIKKVIIESGATSIGSNAFVYCNLENGITIPETVGSIGEGAFQYSDLNRITFPAGLTSIGSKVFYGCENLTELIIPGSLGTIGEYVFHECTGLTRVTIGEGVTGIGVLAFTNCANLVEVNLPGSLETIGVSAFSGCSSLKAIVIPETVTDIGADAFGSCSSLAEVTLPKGLKSLEEGVFYGCSSLKTITLPESITSIGESAFDRSGLESITIPKGVPRIEKSLFNECEDLASVTMQGDVTDIGQSAFMNCTSLVSIEIPKSVTTIGLSAFEGCSGLTGITIPKGVTAIPRRAFHNCSALEAVEVPEGVTSIGEEVFYYCSNLKSITLPGSVSEIQSQAFSNCSNLEKIEIPGGVTSIGTAAFYGCSKLTGVVIPKGVTVIENALFGECSGLTGVTIPAGVTRIGMKAFYECTGLTDVYFGGSEEAWKEITIGTDNDALSSAKIHFGPEEKEQYTVTYHLDGGTNAAGNPASYEEGAAIALAAPTKTGYTFDGWYTEAAFTNKVTEIAEGSKEDKTFYAKWTANTYTIKFDGNGATEGTVADLACTYDADVTLPANVFGKADAVFDGWNTKADGTGTAYADQAAVKNLTVETGAAVILYAQWKDKEPEPEEPSIEPEPEKPEEPSIEPEPEKPEEPSVEPAPEKPEEPPVEPEPVKKKYAITYILDGGVNAASNPAGYEDASDAIMLAEPVKTGYSFVGWYKDAIMTKKKITQIEPGTTGNILLFAKWTANTYTVKFDGNGATGSMKDLKCSYGTWGALIANKFKKTGFNFAGWNTKVDGTGVAYGNEAGVLNLTEKNNDTVTLYAQWKEGGYSITYKNLKGGINHAENPGWYDENTGAVTLKAPTKEGYAFDGWYSDKKLKKSVSGIEAGSTGNKTFYAKWTAGSYTVKFDGNGGEGSMSDLANKVYGKNITLTANKYKRDGYTFAGWNTKKDGTGTPYKNKAKVTDPKTESGTITLYAQWSEMEYKIVYNLKKGANNAANPKTYTVSTDTIVLAAPTKSGYTFGGWYSDKKFKNEVKEISKGSKGNLKLFAKWMK